MVLAGLFGYSAVASGGADVGTAVNGEAVVDGGTAVNGEAVVDGGTAVSGSPVAMEAH